MKKFFALLFLLLIPSCSWSSEYREGEALVVFRTGVNVSVAAEEVEASIAESYEALSEIEGKVIVLVRSSTKTTEQLIEELKARPDVVSATPNYYIRPLKVKGSEKKTPNDPSADLCWGLSAINAPDVWEITTGNREVVYVGIVDSGIYRHPDLEANLEPSFCRNFAEVGEGADVIGTSWDADIVGHGTHIAGTVGAVGNNELGVAGVNWNVGMFSVRVSGTGASESYEISALNYIANLIRSNPRLRFAALNFSFGSYLPITPSEMKETAYYLAYHAVDSLNTTVLVAAAGNEGLEVGRPAQFDSIEEIDGEKKFVRGAYAYPASLPGLNNLIVVGAVASNDTAAPFTSWGESVDVAAPGVGILSTYSPIAEDNPSGRLYTYLEGTSMAAPHVSGAAALLASAYPYATSTQIKESILESANKDKNPVAYPFTYLVESELDVMRNLIGLMIDLGTLAPESRDARIEEERQKLEAKYEPYRELDGRGRVSRMGMLDVRAAYEVLGRKVRGSGSSSGCNAGFMIFGLLIISGVLRKK